MGMEYLLIGVAGALVFLYVLAPLILVAVQEYRIPDYQPFDPHGLPPDMQRYFLDSLNGLTNEGFVVRQYVVAPGLAQNTTPAIALLLNPRTGDEAVVACLFVAGAEGAMTARSPHTEIKTHFSDGRIRITNNFGQSGNLDQGDRLIYLRCRTIADTGLLARLHAFRVEQECPGATRAPTPPGQEVAAAAADQRRYFEDMAARGWLRWAPQQSCWRFTLVGAFAVLYQQLPPLGPMKKERENRQAAALIAEFQRTGRA
jgi:hypothetical protein